jgi:hypothetical protein
MNLQTTPEMISTRFKMKTWRRSILMETKATGLNCTKLKVAVRNKVWWRDVVDILCSKLELQEAFID